MSSADPAPVLVLSPSQGTRRRKHAIRLLSASWLVPGGIPGCYRSDGSTSQEADRNPHANANGNRLPLPGLTCGRVTTEWRRGARQRKGGRRRRRAIKPRATYGHGPNLHLRVAGPSPIRHSICSRKRVWETASKDSEARRGCAKAYGGAGLR